MSKLFKPLVIIAQAIILLSLTLKWWRGSLKDSVERLIGKFKKNK